MQALCFTERGLELREVEPPRPLDNEALIRVSMAGICSTDLEITRGYLNFRGILGHEFVGEIERCGNPKLAGNRVVGEINLGCGACPACRGGLKNHCARRTVLGISGKDGCFAEYLTLPVSNLFRVPDRLDDRLACFVEPTAACFEILEQITVLRNHRVAVLGDGRLGILAAQVLNRLNPDTLLVGRSERKLAAARACGVRTAAPGELEPKSFDLVVEATGSPSGMRTAIELVRPRGSIALKSTYHGQLALDAAPLVIDEIKVIGSRCGPFEPAIAALAGGEVRVEPLIDAVVPLRDGVAAFAKAQEPDCLKILLDMS